MGKRDPGRSVKRGTGGAVPAQKRVEKERRESAQGRYGHLLRRSIYGSSPERTIEGNDGTAVVSGRAPGTSPSPLRRSILVTGNELKKEFSVTETKEWRDCEAAVMASQCSSCSFYPFNLRKLSCIFPNVQQPPNETRISRSAKN